MKFTFKTACSVLADLYEAIPSTWAKEAIGKDEHGNFVTSGDPTAVSWCAWGGLECMGHTWPFGELDPIAAKLGYPGGFIDANNQGGRKVAIKMLRAAAGEISLP